MLAAGLLTAGLWLHAAGLLLLATGLWVLTTGLLLLLVAGLRLLSAGLRLLAVGLQLLLAALRLQLVADPQPSSCGIVVSNQPIGESGWARAGCSVGEGEGGEPSFDLFFCSLLFLSFSLLFFVSWPPPSPRVVHGYLDEQTEDFSTSHQSLGQDYSLIPRETLPMEVQQLGGVSHVGHSS